MFWVLEVKMILGFEVLTPVVMKISLFWGITPCSPLKVNRRFRGIYRRALFARSFLLCLFLYPEDGDDKLLRNICRLRRTTRRYIPENRTLKVRWRMIMAFDALNAKLVAWNIFYSFEYGARGEHVRTFWRYHMKYYSWDISCSLTRWRIPIYNFVSSFIPSSAKPHLAGMTCLHRGSSGIVKFAAIQGRSFSCTEYEQWDDYATGSFVKRQNPCPVFGRSSTQITARKPVMLTGEFCSFCLTASKQAPE
jgi:hypothetical protein